MLFQVIYNLSVQFRVSNTITIQNNSTCELLAKLDREDFYYILQKPPGWTLPDLGWKLVAQQFFLKHLRFRLHYQVHPYQRRIVIAPTSTVSQA